MPVKRKHAGNRRRGKKKTTGGIPAWLWLLGGILIGLGIALVLMLKGYLPEIQQHSPSVDDTPPGVTESALVEGEGTEVAKPEKPRYDFFTVLPEMEVVIPQQELSRKAKPAPGTTPGGELDNYVLQTGSFRSAADAEEMKARLALLGSIAVVQKVTVDNKTWHRVRIGPFAGARKADEMRRMLSDNQIDTLVIKVDL